MKPTKLFALLALVTLTSCTSDGLELPTDPLRLDAAIGQSTLRVGDTTTLVFRLRNVSNESLALNFNTSCQILPYITTRGDAVVYPSGGEWGCYLALTNFTLAPGTERVLSVLVRGGAQASNPGVSILPGAYVAYARLEHPDFPLRSASVTFDIIE